MHNDTILQGYQYEREAEGARACELLEQQDFCIVVIWLPPTSRM